MTTLRETQNLFWRLITAPEGVRQGLADLPDRGRLLPGGLGSVIRGDERISAEERLDVYANMYFYRILDILKEDFPAVTAILGPERFHNLATDYLLVHPSTHPSVRQLGRYLPAFLRGHGTGKEPSWLADLALLEWIVMEVFDGPDAEPVAPDRLRDLPAERWAAMRLGFVPTLRLLRAPAPVNRVWSAVADGNEVPEISAEPVILRVWRRGLRVAHRAIDAVEAAAIEAVLAEEDFGGVCEAVAAAGSENEAAARAARFLQGWFADGLVASVENGVP